MHWADAIAAILLFTTIYTIWIFVPASMAAKRSRSQFLWVTISIFASPIIAILILAALGEDSQ